MRTSPPARKQSRATASAEPRSRAGRPTREEAERRHEELLECALDAFLENGFEQTRILDIATAVGMSKRTVYALYKDKEELFKAAVYRAIERYTVAREVLEAATSDDFAETLKAIARIRIANATTPSGMRLTRILASQSHRFPELLSATFEVGTGPTIDFLSELFQRQQALGAVRKVDTRRAAVAFLSLVVSGPTRIITAGGALKRKEIEERIDFTVGLFLHGICEPIQRR